ncbi:uncharacterized protein A4U43_C05F26210 [Asparagus officinalis]|uniref:Uncharacterized protein n=1 Tax=Asparagus officinalis TaxID=4686 RepID=A0A5P1EUL2_ASPOF|nr:uncharacterized protein A4U43_C05F26210 [Asparagus officinalis]
MRSKPPSAHKVCRAPVRLNRMPLRCASASAEQPAFVAAVSILADGGRMKAALHELRLHVTPAPLSKPDRARASLSYPTRRAAARVWRPQATKLTPTAVIPDVASRH